MTRHRAGLLKNHGVASCRPLEKIVVRHCAGLLKKSWCGIATISKGGDGLRKRRIRIKYGAPLKRGLAYGGNKKAIRTDGLLAKHQN
jgi:hypothetical protein